MRAAAVWVETCQYNFCSSLPIPRAGPAISKSQGQRSRENVWALVCVPVGRYVYVHVTGERHRAVDSEGRRNMCVCVTITYLHSLPQPGVVLYKTQRSLYPGRSFSSSSIAGAAWNDVYDHSPPPSSNVT